MGRVKDIKEEIERVNLEVQQAERDYDLNRFVRAGTALSRDGLVVQLLVG